MENVIYTARGLMYKPTNTTSSPSIHGLTDTRWGSAAKNAPANAGDAGLIPGWGGSPGGGHGSPPRVLAWRLPRTEGPGGLQPRGSQRVHTTEGARRSQFVLMMIQGPSRTAPDSRVSSLSIYKFLLSLPYNIFASPVHYFKTAS